MLAFKAPGLVGVVAVVVVAGAELPAFLVADRVGVATGTVTVTVRTRVIGGVIDCVLAAPLGAVVAGVVCVACVCVVCGCAGGVRVGGVRVGGVRVGGVRVGVGRVGVVLDAVVVGVVGLVVVGVVVGVVVVGVGPVVVVSVVVGVVDVLVGVVVTSETNSVDATAPVYDVRVAPVEDDCPALAACRLYWAACRFASASLSVSFAADGSSVAISWPFLTYWPTLTLTLCNVPLVAKFTSCWTPSSTLPLPDTVSWTTPACA